MGGLPSVCGRPSVGGLVNIVNTAGTSPLRGPHSDCERLACYELFA